MCDKQNWMNVERKVIYRLHGRRGGEGNKRGSREDFLPFFPHASRKRRFCLPLSIVLLSICFLPSSSYLSDWGVLMGLGLTSANRQGHTVHTVWVALCSRCAVSFLLILNPHISRCVSFYFSVSEMKMDWEVHCVCVYVWYYSVWPLSCCRSPSRLCCVHCQEKQHRL